MHVLGLYLVLLAFIQIGYSYYASVASLAVVTVLAINLRSAHNFKAMVFDRGLIRGLASLLMIVTTASYVGATGSDVLRTLREALMFFLITGCLNWRMPGFRAIHVHRSVKYVLIFTLIMFTFVFVQAYYLQRNVYVGIPARFFSQEMGTIPGVLALLYTHPRPMGTFGEPSYLGGVCLSLLFALSPFLTKTRLSKVAATLLIGITVASKTLVGIFSTVLFAAVHVYRTVRPLVPRLVVLGVMTAIFLAILLNGDLGARLLDIGAGNDRSSMNRIVRPLLLIPTMLSSHPSGIPFRLFIGGGYIPTAGQGLSLTDNGLLNLIFNYGWIGVAAILVMFFCLRDNSMRLYFALLSMQNGALLAPDKFYLIAISMLLCNSLTEHATRYVPRARGCRRRLEFPSKEVRKSRPPLPTACCGTVAGLRPPHSQSNSAVGDHQT